MCYTRNKYGLRNPHMFRPLRRYQAMGYLRRPRSTLSEPFITHFLPPFTKNESLTPYDLLCRKIETTALWSHDFSATWRSLVYKVQELSASSSLHLCVSSILRKKTSASCYLLKETGLVHMSWLFRASTTFQYETCTFLANPIQKKKTSAAPSHVFPLY